MECMVREQLMNGFFGARAARAAFGTVGSRLRLSGSTTGIHGPFIQNAQSKIVIFLHRPCGGSRLPGHSEGA